MRVIVTCGPGSEPIDQVRFISNFSTGELGALLAGALKKRGADVICLQSRLSLYPIDSSVIRVIPFTTNADLATSLEQLAQEEPIAAIFHAAALCDYRIEKITTLGGEPLCAGKIPTAAGSLHMTLQPSMKVIAKLRTWFPSSVLVGWKYEVDGTPQEAIAQAHDQLKKYQLDASVANGPACKNSFEFISNSGMRKNLASKSTLVSFLAQWIDHGIIEKFI